MSTIITTVRLLYIYKAKYLRAYEKYFRDLLVVGFCEKYIHIFRACVNSWREREREREREAWTAYHKFSLKSDL